MTRVPLSDDVLRGLRWGAILLAGLAIGVVCYRLMLESPPKPVSQPIQQVPAAPPAAPAQKGRIQPAEGAPGDRPVPSPPPMGAKAAR